MAKLLVLILVYIVVGITVEVAEELWCVHFSKELFGATKPFKGPIECRKGVYDAEYFVHDLKEILTWPWGLLCIGVALHNEQKNPGSIREHIVLQEQDYSE